MRNLTLMYHFVSDSGDPRSFSTAKFKAQLEHLARLAEPVSLRDLVERRPSGPTFSVTFDDGLKDGWTVLPILESLGVRASFYVSTEIWDRGEVLQTQKRQLLLRKLGPAGLAAAFNARVEPVFRVSEGDVPRNHYDDALSTALKYVMDRMDWDTSQRVIGELFAEHFDEADEFSRLYLTVEDARAMIARGHEIGLHGYSHRRLAELYFEDQRRDLERAAAVFTDRLGRRPREISYPLSSFNLFTFRIVRGLGLDIGATTAKRYNESVAKPLELCRFDCIDVPPAKADLPDGGFGS